MGCVVVDEPSRLFVPAAKAGTRDGYLLGRQFDERDCRSGRWGNANSQTYTRAVCNQHSIWSPSAFGFGNVDARFLRARNPVVERLVPLSTGYLARQVPRATSSRGAARCQRPPSLAISASTSRAKDIAMEDYSSIRGCEALKGRAGSSGDLRRACARSSSTPCALGSVAHSSTIAR
jgi:hypothetical protein